MTHEQSVPNEPKTANATNEKSHLIYVFDAYCGWCYGFGPHLAAFVARHRDEIDLTVISGGLFLGERVVPAPQLTFIHDANLRITELTGAQFGSAFAARMADPTFAMDSFDAARGFAALRAEAPTRALEAAEAQQAAFYQRGLSLSDPETYRAVAADLGLDPAKVVANFLAPRSESVATDDFRTSRTLGVTSFPTLLIRTPDGQLHRLGGPSSTPAQLDAALAAFRAH